MLYSKLSIVNLQSLSWTDVALFLSAVYLSRILCICFYNLFLHPLRNYPGPKFAAMSTGYAFYWNAIRGGELHHQLWRLHRRYGPVVRIEPNKLHFSSLGAYNAIYTTAASIIQKDPSFYHRFGDTNGIALQADHLEARRRRDVVAHDFSRRNSINMQGVIQQEIEDFISIITGWKQETDGDRGVTRPRKIDIYRAFRSLTLDLASMFALGSSLKAIEVPDYTHPLIPGMEVFVLPMWWRVHSRIVAWVFGEMLFAVVRRLGTGVGAMGGVEKNLVAIYQDAVAGKGERLEKRKTQAAVTLSETELHKREPIIPRMVDSGWSERLTVGLCADLILAGTDTVGNALMTGTTHLILHPEHSDRLLDELRGVWPDLTTPPPSVHTLEKLPILQGVVRESLRLSPGVVSPLWRVAKKDIIIDGHHIPANTSIGSSGSQIHLNPDIFTNPREFDPTRWMNLTPQEYAKLSGCLVAFSKGPRACVGINLAYIELTMIFATIWRKCEMKLDEGFRCIPVAGSELNIQ